jgi:glutaredoxin-like protein NrdH
VDITTDEDAYKLVKSLGYSYTPVVVSGDTHWSGFRPDKIASLKVIRDEVANSVIDK